jgi:restriction system protein
LEDIFGKLVMFSLNINFEKLILKSLAILVIVILVYSWIAFFIKKEYKVPKRECSILNENELMLIESKIKILENSQFEELCYLIFSKCGKWKTVELKKNKYDNGKDIILDSNIYVGCKKDTEDIAAIEICERLVGAMVVDGIKKGVIITTVNLPVYALDYIIKLDKNSDITIDIMSLETLIGMIKEIDSSEILKLIGINSYQVVK